VADETKNPTSPTPMMTSTPATPPANATPPSPQRSPQASTQQAPLTTQSQRESEAGVASDAAPSSPINTGESLSERIARIKREEAQRETTSSPTTGLAESSNRSTTAASATRNASDPQQAASTQHVRADATVAAGATTLRGVGPQGKAAPNTDTATASQQLADQGTGRVTDGSKTGERARATSTSIVPESNDVMLGDQSTRKDGPKDTAGALPTVRLDDLKEDGSESPHDATSEGGSRQALAHQQLRDAAKVNTEEDETEPAFKAEAKARTI
jgi:hypothetical protein